jgi:hypothetical protein
MVKIVSVWCILFVVTWIPFKFKIINQKITIFRIDNMVSTKPIPENTK